MTARVLPIALALAALVAARQGHPDAALYLLLAAVPAAAAWALDRFGALVEHPGRARGIRRKRADAALAAVALLFVVVAAAASAQAPERGLAVSAAVAALALYVLQALAALSVPVPRFEQPAPRYGLEATDAAAP